MTAALDPAEGVLMVLDGYFPSAGGGGAESQVRTLSLRMIERRVSVRVVTPMLRAGRQVECESVDGIPVHRIRYPQVRLLGSLVMLVRLALLLVRERHRYSAIHAHVAKNLAAICAVVGRALGKPVVVKLTGMLELEHGILAADTLHRRLLRRAIRSATWVQATSQRIRAQLLRCGFDEFQVRTVPNAIDTARFGGVPARRAAVRRELRIAPGDLVGVYCGRLEPEKGVALLVEAWAAALGARQDAWLLLVGEGRLRPRIEADLARLGLLQRVLLLGARDEVERYLDGADFAVLPSFAEGLSNSLLECMASALPVVGTRVSGTEDLVRDGETGWLIEPRDPRGLEAALRAVADEPRAVLRARGDAARRRIAEYASLDRVVETLAALYGMPFPEPPPAPATSQSLPSGARPGEAA